MFINRLLFPQLKSTLKAHKNVLLLGARQTGKSSLSVELQPDLKISLMHLGVRQQFEKDPGSFITEVTTLADELKKPPLVMLDEVQVLPKLLDAVQYLIDEKQAQFIITGSSARKLRTDKVNLLPGRIHLLHLDPFMYEEVKDLSVDLEKLLIYGSLPAVTLAETEEERAQLLQDYVITYIESEIRAEAAVRNVSGFVRFLPLAAEQSGKLVNFNKLSQEVGVAHTTIANYYQILEDCLIAYRIEPLTKSKKRARLVKTPKYLFFDLGVRHFCAQASKATENLASLFEQYVGLELLRWLNILGERQTLFFWRDNNGPEIDWVVKYRDQYFPIEVKWTKTPKLADAKHLQLFLDEYPEAKQAYIICQVEKRLKLADNIYALPWQEIKSIFGE